MKRTVIIVSGANIEKQAGPIDWSATATINQHCSQIRKAITLDGVCLEVLHYQQAGRGRRAV